MRAYMSAVLWLAGLLLLFAAPSPARADDAIDAWAQWAVAPKVWNGQTVPVPEDEPRPTGLSVVLDSLDWPVRLHVARASTSAQRSVALRALEAAGASWFEQRWPAPVPDGGLGGSNAFDAYLVPGLERAAVGRADQPVLWADFDTASGHALVSADLTARALAVCVHSAYAQGALHALDPAEAESLVRASAEFLAWHATGEPGCADSMVAGQLAPERSALGDDLAAAGSGALLLALLSERHGAGTTDFVRALWELTRQRSHGLVDSDRLRGSPDIWEVLAQVLKMHDDDLRDTLDEFAVARFFTGEPRRRAAAAYRIFADLPSDATVPLLADLASEELPKHIRTAADGGVESLGSAYVRVRTAGRTELSELRVWLRGELGADWSLTALRLAADGHEVGRTRAPVRQVPESYVPLLLEPDTYEVILVVTQLPRRTPDADWPAISAHGFDLSMDLVTTH